MHTARRDGAAVAGSLALMSAALPSPRSRRMTLLREVKLQPMAIREVSGTPLRLVQALKHPDAVFVVTLMRGACHFATERGDVELREGQFVVLGGDLTLQVEHGRPFLLRGTRLPAAELERELPRWRATELLPVAAAGASLLQGLQDQLLLSGSHFTRRSADAYAQTLACSIADALRGVMPAADAWQTRADYHRRRIRAYVRQHLADPALDADAVASGVGLSVAHLHRLFAAEPQSLFTWVQAERLEACRAALAADGGRRLVTEVALAWGFQHAAHFSRSFRRRYGVSPRDWRAQAARGETAAPAPPLMPPG